MPDTRFQKNAADAAPPAETERDSDSASTARRLREREAQQAAVADLGTLALRSQNLDTFLQDATEAVAGTLELPLTEVLELEPDGEHLVLRAGVGWREGLVGLGRVDTVADSQAGHTLRSREPVVVTEMATETRFNGPPLLVDHGVVAGMSVIIGDRDEPWGVLGAHATHARTFNADDVNFIQSVANVVYSAIRKHADAENLRSTVDRMQLALDAGRMGSWDWDPRTDRAVWTEGMFELLGIDPDTSPGYGPWSERLHPDDRERVHASFADALAAGAPYEAEYRIMKPDGEVRWVEARGIFHTDDAGQPSRAVGVVQDIDERKRLQEEIRRSARQKDEFLALLGHELRNPLAAINTGLELIREPPGPEAFRSAVEMIGRQTSQLRRLVDDLLHVSRITRGDIEIRPRPLRLAPAVEAVTSSLGQLMRDRTIAIEFPDGDELVAQVDPARFEQILSNLLTNAVKYTDAGGRIRVRGTREDNQAVIKVIDDGIGMNAETLGRAFEPFVRGAERPGDQQPGLGVGLTLVHKLVELHGGSITANSEGPGEGSTFTVRLPLSEAPVAEAPTTTVARRARAGVKPMRVLIVDDNRDMAEGMQMLLEQAGHEVAVAYDGASGVDKAASWEPAAMLVDIGLPDTDGFAVARQVRARLPRVWIAAVSGFTPSEDAPIPDSIDRYLVKPVDVAEILGLLGELHDNGGPRPD